MKKLLIVTATALLAMATAYGASTEQAAELLKGFEGFRPSVYKCEAGKPTIGYGFTSAAMVGKEHITEGEASAELSRLCDGIVANLRKELGKGNILKPNEEAAVVSFIYNVGWGAFKSSTMFRLLKDGKRGAAVGAEFRKWVYVTKDGKKVVSKGLANRRSKEAATFLGVA